MEKIKKILSKYSASDLADFKATVDMLCKKGVGNGVYQDYTILIDVIEILSACERVIGESK